MSLAHQRSGDVQRLSIVRLASDADRQGIEPRGSGRGGRPGPRPCPCVCVQLPWNTARKAGQLCAQLSAVPTGLTPLPSPPPPRYLLLIFLLSEESNLHLQGSGRLHCRCGTRPKARIMHSCSQERSVRMEGMNQRLGLRPPHSHVIATVSVVI